VSRTYSGFTIIILFSVFILCGISTIFYLNFNINTKKSISSLSVYFQCVESDPIIIEEKVTSKLEALFALINGVSEINSSSGPDYGNINLIIDKKANIDLIKYEVCTLIRQIWPEMPTGFSYPVVNSIQNTGESQRPILTFNINASISPSTIQQYTNDHIKPLLSQIPGVSKIEILGAPPLEWIIQYDTDLSEMLGITRNEIQHAISINLKKESLGIGLEPNYDSVTIINKNQNSTSESRNLLFKNHHSIEVSESNQEEGNSSIINCASNYPVIINTNITEANEILNIPIKKIGDKIIYLHEIATINHVEGESSRNYRINGKNTINILIYAENGKNSLIIGKKLKKAINELRNKIPSGYELLISDDSTEYIFDELLNIGLRSILSLVFLLLFILIVSKQLKYIFLIIIMMFGNLCIALFFYYIFNLQLNLIALAGITVSLGLMTDNIIIMSQHILTHNNKRVFLAILAGTLSIVAPLATILFLKEQVKNNLQDFAYIIIINEFVSLLTAFFVIPAIMDKLKLEKFKSLSNQILIFNPSKFQKKYSRHKLHNIVQFKHIYERILLFLQKEKIILILALILCFGLPTFILPDKLDGNKWFNKAYNFSIGNEWFKANARPLIDRLLGGTLRLFEKNVYNGSYIRNPEETSLFVSASMPYGSRLAHSNELALKMESFLKQFREIKLFQTNITSKDATFSIYFKKEYQRSSFPYMLKNFIIKKTNDLGIAEWSVNGFGEGFSNQMNETTGTYTIKLLGYNYEQLSSIAERVKDSLILNPRLKQVFILPKPKLLKPDNVEFYAQFNNHKLSESNVSPSGLFELMKDKSQFQPLLSSSLDSKGLLIRLIPRNLNTTELWSFMHNPLIQDSLVYKLYLLSSINKGTMTPSINKIDQQYQIYLQFDYIGPVQQANEFIEQTIKSIKPYLSLGFSILSDYKESDRSKQNLNEYWLLPLLIIIIFFICSILFESLLQPLAVIFTIPVSYIGIFLTFYLFEINFDQGGFAAMVILTGLTVNSAIYILNDYNNLCKQYSGRNINFHTLYFKALNSKIIPIFLTIIATCFGFVPFLIGEKESFWYALASGTIGGLTFSLIGIIFYLPLFLKRKRY
jgi:multidrug efflux pump subunit AcrB